MSTRTQRLRVASLVALLVVSGVAGAVAVAGSAAAASARTSHELATRPPADQVGPAGRNAGVRAAGPPPAAQNASGTASFGQQTYVDQRGDVVNVTIDLNASDRAVLTVGGPDVNYVANVSVEDGNGDGQVTVQWNTYAAGSTQNLQIGAQQRFVFDTASDEDHLTVLGVNTSVAGGMDGEMLDPALYPLAVRGGENATGEEDSVAAVDLRQRSTRSLSVWTASSRRTIALNTPSDVQRLTDDGNLTRADRVALGDLSVFRINASGLEGAIAVQRGNTPTQRFLNFLDSDLANLTVRRQIRENELPAVWKYTGDRTTKVVPDPANDTYYVLVKTRRVTAVSDRNATAGEQVNVSDGDRWTANFTVSDGALADGRQSVTGNFTTVDPEINFSETPYNVTASADAVIRGSTTLAPGTVLDVHYESSNGTVPPFTNDTIAVVSRNRTWRVPVDFSAQNATGRFVVTVSDGQGTRARTQGYVVAGG
ncbi:MAG: BGTF surface domain-containing protein [Salinigranum sp.]